MVDLSLITIPTPQPYDDKNPTQQQENWCYVLLQLVGQMKATNDRDPFGIVDALRSAHTGVSVELDDLSVKTFNEAALIESF